MGLLKAGAGALGGILADQWRDYFYCDALEAGVLAAKGKKRTSRRSSNTKGDENIISNGSILAVNEGQCMLIVEQGKIVEVCAEAGEFLYDSGTEPSVFYGGLGKGLLGSFATLGKRFGFGGDTAMDQRVYYFNTKEIVGNKYGTTNPIPFRVVDRNIGLDVDISIRCNGEFSYRIADPLLFYKNVCGNVSDVYRRSEIDSMLRAELLTALQPAFAAVSAQGVRYSALPGHAGEIAGFLNQALSQKWQNLRGLTVSSFGINSVNASPEDEAMIKELQRTAVMRDPTMAAATLVGAQGEAMKSAAKNEGGAMLGFMGLNMASAAGSMNPQQLYQMGGRPQAAEPTPAAPASWTCSCGAQNSGKFCTECGSPRPTGWTCSCGAVNRGKFCTECGKPKPSGAPLYRCDKCGWEPEDPKHPPKFCPECGDPFDSEDIR